MAITLVTVCTPLKLLITGTVKYQRVISIKKHSKAAACNKRYRGGENQHIIPSCFASKQQRC